MKTVVRGNFSWGEVEGIEVGEYDQYILLREPLDEKEEEFWADINRVRKWECAPTIGPRLEYIEKELPSELKDARIYGLKDETALEHTLEMENQEFSKYVQENHIRILYRLDERIDIENYFAVRSDPDSIDEEFQGDEEWEYGLIMERADGFLDAYRADMDMVKKIVKKMERGTIRAYRLIAFHDGVLVSSRFSTGYVLPSDVDRTVSTIHEGALISWQRSLEDLRKRVRKRLETEEKLYKKVIRLFFERHGGYLTLTDRGREFLNMMEKGEPL